MLAGHVLDNALVAEPDDCWPVGAMRHAQRERRVEAGGYESVGVGRRVLYAHAARLHEPMRDLRAVPRVHGFAESVAAAAGGRHREEREEQGSSLASVKRRRRSRRASRRRLSFHSRKKEKAARKQEHNALSHMTSDPTTAIVGTTWLHEGWGKRENRA